MMRNAEIYRSDLRAACEGAAQDGALRGKRILVTGATGLIGSFLVDTLLLLNAERDARVEILAAGRSPDGMRRRFGDDVENPRFHYIPYDATRPLSIDADADYIVHAACAAHPMAYATDPVGTMQANLFGTMNLLEYARSRPRCRFLLLSTGETYGQKSDLTDGFREGDHGYIDPMNPRSCYPESKRAAETLCASYAAQHGTEALAARLCHVYGPTFTPQNSRADAQFLRNVLTGEDIVMKSTGSQVRSYCYVADAVSAILTLLRLGEKGQAYNVANRRSVASIADYAKTLAELGGVALRFDLPSGTEQAGYSKITRAVLNPEKLEALGWRPKFDLEQGLRHTLLACRAAARADREADQA